MAGTSDLGSGCGGMVKDAVKQLVKSLEEREMEVSLAKA